MLRLRNANKEAASLAGDCFRVEIIHVIIIFGVFSLGKLFSAEDGRVWEGSSKGVLSKPGCASGFRLLGFGRCFKFGAFTGNRVKNFRCSRQERVENARCVTRIYT